MILDVELIKDFCKKHSLGWSDRRMQEKCIKEEVKELKRARQQDELKEAVDVLVTVLVYAEISGFLDAIEEEFERKMRVNIDKPKRIGRGKVKK